MISMPPDANAPTGSPQPINPFDKDSAPGVQLVVLMRCYDALMAILQATDMQSHNDLDAIHESGGLAWSLPFLDLKPESAPAESEDAIVPPVSPVPTDGPDPLYRVGD